MKIPRFFIKPGTGTEASFLLSSEESHHAHSVLRLKAGDAVELFDGQGRVYTGTVLGATGGRMSIQVNQNSASAAAPAVRVTLAPCLIKPERMELLIQKACELGVYQVAPLVSERTVIRLSGERLKGKQVRWQKIAAESCKQCGRSVMPRVLPASRFEDFIARADGYDMILLPTLAVPAGGLREALGDKLPRNILVLIGPEGDFTPGEAHLAASRGAFPVTLGSLVMRSETASLYLLSALNFFFGEAIHESA